MFGLTHQQLTQTDQRIEQLRRIIAVQVDIVEKMKRIGVDSRRADLVLASLNDLMATYQVHRQKIAAALS